MGQRESAKGPPPRAAIALITTRTRGRPRHEGWQRSSRRRSPSTSTRPRPRASLTCVGCTRSSRRVAPRAEEAIKWGNPFFVEPRFLFAFSAHKAHCSLAPVLSAMEHFREELKEHATTKNTLKVPYDEPLPEDLIRRIGEYCLRVVGEREDDGFW